MIDRSCILYTAIVVLLAVAACGQDEPLEASRDYFPLVKGATFTYFHSSKGGWEETVTVEKGDGADEFILTDTENPDGERSENTLKRDGTAVLRIEKEVFLNGALAFSVDYVPGFVRFDESWLDSEPPFEVRREYTRIETDAVQGQKTPRPRAHIFLVQSFSETVELEAGTFHNCLVLRRQRALDSGASAVDAGVTGAAATDDQAKRFWFAPGVGKVKEYNEETANTEELVDYDIPEQ